MLACHVRMESAVSRPAAAAATGERELSVSAALALANMPAIVI